jgi:hypothetical protein
MPPVKESLMKNSAPKPCGLDRRQFLRATALMAGGACLSPWALRAATETAPALKRTAADQVALGKTGIKLSRLGFGTGVNSGHDQVALGKETFVKLIRHAYDQASPTLTPPSPT